MLDRNNGDKHYYQVCAGDYNNKKTQLTLESLALGPM